MPSRPGRPSWSAGAGAIGTAVIERLRRSRRTRSLGIDLRGGEGIVACDVSSEESIGDAFAGVRRADR